MSSPPPTASMLFSGNTVDSRKAFEAILSAVFVLYRLSPVFTPSAAVTQMSMDYYHPLYRILCTLTKTTVCPEVLRWIGSDSGPVVLYFSGLTGRSATRNVAEKVEHIRNILKQVSGDRCSFEGGVYHSHGLYTGDQELGPSLIIVLVYILTFGYGFCGIPHHLMTSQESSPLEIDVEGTRMTKTTSHMVAINEDCRIVHMDGVVTIPAEELNTAVHSVTELILKPLLLPFVESLLYPDENVYHPSIQFLLKLLRLWAEQGYNRTCFRLGVFSSVTIDLHMICPELRKERRKSVTKTVCERWGYSQKKTKSKIKKVGPGGVYVVTAQCTEEEYSETINVEGVVLPRSKGSIHSLFLPLQHVIYIMPCDQKNDFGVGGGTRKCWTPNREMLIEAESVLYYRGFDDYVRTIEQQMASQT